MTDISTRHQLGPRNQFQVERDDFKGIKLGSEAEIAFSTLSDAGDFTVRHYYDGFEKFTTVIDITEIEIPTVHTTGAWGGVKLGEFGQDRIVFATGQIRGLGGVTSGIDDIDADAVIKYAVGTAAASALALGTTMSNIITARDAPANAASAFSNVSLQGRTPSITEVNLTAAAAAARGVWLNASIPDADSTQDGTITLTSGLVIFSWFRASTT